ncbi:MAG: hypothetical protein IJS29_06615 [Selenomonadaceae bacterium]|nr:hypothetical protein [Selenomonadaceae bacterium]
MEFVHVVSDKKREVIKKTAQEILKLLDGMNTKLARRALEIAIEELETNSTVSQTASQAR